MLSSGLDGSPGWFHLFALETATRRPLRRRGGHQEEELGRLGREREQQRARGECGERMRCWKERQSVWKSWWVFWEQREEWSCDKTDLFYLDSFLPGARRAGGIKVYRARTPVHRALVELLPHGEGDVGGADGGGSLDGELLSVLRDLHQWLGGGFHCDLAQHHVHPWNKVKRDVFKWTCPRNKHQDKRLI